MKTLTYIGTVSPTGEIKLPKRLRAEVGKTFAGKDVIVTFARPKKTRSSEQNRYYWGVVVRMVCEGFQALGNPVNPDSVEDAELVHTYLKRRFLEPIRVADANGEIHELEPSLEDAAKQEMGEYIDKCIAFALEYLNIHIPAPNEQAEINF